MSILDVRNLSKEFIMHIRGGKRISSFSGVSFSLEQGNFLGISGPSGIGKSSLLKCIYRTYIPSGGSVLYDSHDYGTIDLVSAEEHSILDLRRAEIGFVTQFFHVIPRIPAIEILTGTMMFHGKEMDEALVIAEEYLHRLGIPKNLWQMFPSTFSGGEKQRLNIIHAIISKPRLLLLDEPTASLDSKTKGEVVKLLMELKQTGTTMIGVFHDHETMMELADQEYRFEVPEQAVV